MPSIKNIWGKVVLFLRENHQIALYVACGDITDVEISENKLIVLVEDLTMFTLLLEGQREIERALRWQGVDLDVEIRQKVVPASKADEDVDTLSKMFGERLTIKN